MHILLPAVEHNLGTMRVELKWTSYNNNNTVVLRLSLFLSHLITTDAVGPTTLCSMAALRLHSKLVQQFTKIQTCCFI